METNSKHDNKKVDYLPYEPRMKPTDPDSLNTKRTILISFSFFTVLIAWAFFNFKVPLLLDDALGTFPLKDLAKGTIMAMDNLIAVILQPFFGDMSDRTKSRFGRRMPYIVVGTISSAVFFIFIPWMQILAGLILIIFLFDLAMSIYRSASIAILPDYTSEKVYSKGSAIQQFIANMGGLLAFVIPIVLGIVQSSLSSEWFNGLGFLIVAIIMIIFVGILFITIKETPTGDKWLELTHNKIEIDSDTFKTRELEEILEEPSKKKQRLRTYKDSIIILKNHKNFAFFLGTVIFMYLAFASIESFFSSFAIDYFNISEGEASTLFIAYSAPMIATAYFVGLFGQSKRVGREKAVKIFLIWLILAIFIMAVFVVPTTYHNHNPLLVITVLILIAIPWMGFIVNSFSILWALAPKGKVGIYTGIYYTFNQSAYALAPIIFGGLLSIFNFLGDYRYIIMFPYILVLVVIALLFFFRMKSGNDQSEEIKE